MSTQSYFSTMSSKSPNSNNIMNSDSMENFVPPNFIQNKDLILNKNFFEIFDFFDENKQNIVQSYSFYHKYGIKIYFNYCPDVLTGNYANLKIEGSEYNSIYISIDEYYNISNFDIVSMCHYSAEIIIDSLKYIDKMILLGEALGIRIDNTLDNIKEKIKYMNYPIIEIKETECLISNRSLLVDKNIFDIIKCINPTKFEYIYNEPKIQIKINYEISTFFTPMVTFNLHINDHKYCVLCFYFEKKDNYIIKEVYIMYDYPFAIEFILNKLQHVDDGIITIGEALGIKLNYTHNELTKMQQYL